SCTTDLCAQLYPAPFASALHRGNLGLNTRCKQAIPENQSHPHTDKHTKPFVKEALKQRSSSSDCRRYLRIRGGDDYHEHGTYRNLGYPGPIWHAAQSANGRCQPDNNHRLQESQPRDFNAKTRQYNDKTDSVPQRGNHAKPRCRYHVLQLEYFVAALIK